MNVTTLIVSSAISLGFVGCGGKAVSYQHTTESGGAAPEAGVGESGAGGTGGSAGTAGSGGGAGGTVGDGGLAGSGGTGGTGGSAGGACPTDCGPLEECWNGELCVAKSVGVNGGFRIDATEVTMLQYDAWLSTNPATSGQPSYCSWNTSYEPSCEWPTGTEGHHPVLCADWCDAYAYCAAVGKRLCGKIGGGSYAYDDYDDPSASQWYAACTSGGVNEYPYGNTYSEETCNGTTGATPVEVGAMGGCQSSVAGYEGVYDLSGNVWEWTDHCSGKMETLKECRVRGGSWHSSAHFLRCDYNVRIAPDVEYIGFRCCSDP